MKIPMKSLSTAADGASLVALALVPALALALTLGGCDSRDDSRTPGQQVDAAIAKTEQKVDAAKAEIKREAEQAKQATGAATVAVATAVSDTATTAAIKARLATDKELKAVDISVETQGGRVALRGTAPSQPALERAVQIAGAVQGVMAVDNHLSVAPR